MSDEQKIEQSWATFSKLFRQVRRQAAELAELDERIAKLEARLEQRKESEAA